MDRQTKRNKSDFQWFMFLMFLAVIFGYLLNGCDTVTIKERVLYDDKTPVTEAKVTQFNETFKGGTFTNDNGEWTMEVPEDVFIGLCIEEYERDIGKACYENGYLLTPTIESGLHELKRIEK